MKKLTAFLLSLTLFFAGLSIGFILSPVKKGIFIGNNSGNKDNGRTAEKFADIYR